MSAGGTSSSRFMELVFFEVFAGLCPASQSRESLRRRNPPAPHPSLPAVREITIKLALALLIVLFSPRWKCSHPTRTVSDTPRTGLHTEWSLWDCYRRPTYSSLQPSQLVSECGEKHS
jgi:hypothetical protein